MIYGGKTSVRKVEQSGTCQMSVICDAQSPPTQTHLSAENLKPPPGLPATPNKHSSNIIEDIFVAVVVAIIIIIVVVVILKRTLQCGETPPIRLSIGTTVEYELRRCRS